MKHIILFIKMIIYYPSIQISALHINKNDFELNQVSAKMWSTILLKFVKVKTEIKHINHIPLEDGFIFLAYDNNPYDSIILLSIFPINISFIFDRKIKLPFLRNWFRRIKTLFIDSNYDFVENVDIIENLMNKSGNLLLYINQLDKLKSLNSFIDYAYHTKKTLIPISINGSNNVMKKGKYHKVLVDICLPLHYEEYQTMTNELCIEEIKDRISQSTI
jgi:1-acyl-sn-glycerol-3-phosphate acyltransferase